MTQSDNEPSFGLSGSIIQERQRLLEEKLNRSRQNGVHSPSNVGPSVASGSTGQNFPSSSSNYLSARQGSQQFAPLHINPVELPLDSRQTLFSRNTNPAKDEAKLVPRPLPGNSTTNIPKPSAPTEPKEPIFTETLIPVKIMPAYMQRRVLSLIFCCLQLAKFIHLYKTESFNTGFLYGLLFHSLPQFLQWFIADSLLFGLILILRIPLLGTTSQIIIFCFVALQLLNIMMLIGITPILSFLSSLLLPNKTHITEPVLPIKEVSSGPLEIGLGSEKEISREELLTGSSHLLGRYTVKILPDSIVKMNPEGQSFCLNRRPDQTFDGPVYIPIYINGTNPFKLKYSFTNMKGQRMQEREIILARFATDNLVDNDSQLTTGTYLLAADLPGRYFLESVLDKEDYNFRQESHYREVIVAPCPYALFSSSTSNDITHCLGSPYPSLKISAFGIPPFTVTYSRQVNSSEHLTRVTGEKLPATGEPLDSVALVESHDTFSVELDANNAGKYHYRIVRIQDRFNNLVSYDGSSEVFLNRNLFVHSPPTSESSCDLAREYFLSPKYSQAKIPIRVTGSAPFKVDMGFCPEGSEESCVPEVTSKEFNSLKTIINVSKPGSYRVLSITDQYCSTNIEPSKPCIVSTVPPPSLKIIHEPIISTCQFEIGLEVTLMMSGQPPFNIKYYEKVTDGNGQTKKISRQINTANLIHHLKLTPELSGLYQYEFYEVASDDYGPISIKNELRQLVKALPNAKFSNLPEIPARTCINWPISSSLSTIQLYGQGPWSLNYTVFYKDEVIPETLTGLTQSKLELNLPNFAKSGRYSIQLSRISDGSDCFRSLDAPPLLVDVRATNPSVAFKCGGDSSELWSLKGQKTSLPIHLTGDAPWEVEMILPNNDTRVIKLNQASDGIPAFSEGQYKLNGIRDSYCPGVVSDNYECSLRWHPQPTLSLIPSVELEKVNPQNFIRRGICQGVPDNLPIQLTGRSPWSVEYSISFPESNELPMDLRAEFSNETSLLSLDTLIPGAHVYTFHKVGDGLYSNHQPDLPLRFDQDVFARPSAWFTTQSPLHQCSEQDIENVTIEFTGQAPFEVIMEWRDSAQRPQPIHLKDILHSTHRFSLAGRSPGSHALRIVRVIDANGCIGGAELGLEDNKPALLRVDVVAPPTLLPSSPAARRSNACIGERLNYILSGISPWVVQYSMNDTIRQTSPQSDPQFRRLIDTPGVFQVSQVCHLPGLGASCCSTPSLAKVQIHPLPGAWLAGGSEQFINIHNGENTRIQVDLAGIPPFKFTYTRRNIRSRQLLETQSISDVNTSKYFIDTSLEGIFEVVSVQDKFCAYPFPTIQEQDDMS